MCLREYQGWQGHTRLSNRSQSEIRAAFIDTCGAFSRFLTILELQIENSDLYEGYANNKQSWWVAA